MCDPTNSSEPTSSHDRARPRSTRIRRGGEAAARADIALRAGQDRDLEASEVAELLHATETAVRTGGSTGDDAAVTWIETRRILDRYRAGQVPAEHALDLIDTWHQPDEPKPPSAYDDSDEPF